MDVEKWIVGDEYDQVALAGLGGALRDSGYELEDQWSAVAGSQDISHWEVRGPSGSLTIEVETYVGITVEGPSALISALRAAFSIECNRAATSE
jgi:hypothetical protein